MDLKRKYIIEKDKIVREQGFYLTIEYMHGDADAYQSETYGPFPNEETFDDFFDMIDSIDGREAPAENIYWNTWEGEDIPEEKQSYITEELIEKIDYEPVMDSCWDDCLARINCKGAEYVDEYGNTHYVDWEYVRG